VSAPSKPRTYNRNTRHIDQVMRAGDGVLAIDQGSLALVRDLRVMLMDVIQALEDDFAQSGAVEVLAAADAGIQLSER
jgi:hypothetical protein